MINKQRFGKRIGELRRKLGLSQTQLAEKLCVSAQAISKWENGVTLPDIELLLQLSRLYRISVNELLEDDALLRQIVSGAFEEKCGMKAGSREIGTTPGRSPAGGQTASMAEMRSGSETD